MPGAAYLFSKEQRFAFRESNMKPKTLTFYGAESKLSQDHQEVQIPGGESFFLRITESSEGAFHALDNTKPMEGETVLNTLEIGSRERACTELRLTPTRQSKPNPASAPSSR